MKDHLREYCTSAFQFYALNGRSTEKYKKKIYDESLENMSKFEKAANISKPTEAAIMRAEQALNDVVASIRDMEAVELVLDELRAGNKFVIIEAIELVYFNNSNENIKTKVQAAESIILVTKSTIYNWLQKARFLFAEKRGLRL